jgi:ADP-ribose pyrophosphatase YjhB (NUDIX family)
MSYVAWLRERVGHLKVFLPYATVIVRDDHGRVLLQRRTDFSFWGLPGGVLELDEDIETGARREVAEETGLTVGSLRLVGLYADPRYDIRYPNGDEVQQFTVCLEGRVNGGMIQVDGHEVSAQQFVEPADLPTYNLPLWYRDMLADAGRQGPPAFRPPYTAPQTADQIATVRPYLGTALYAGIGVSVAVVREDGRVLLLQHKGETGWRLPAGFADLGENAAQTAVREIYEETRLTVLPERLLGVHASPELNVTYANGDRVRVVGAVFRARILGGEMQLDKTEITAMEWVYPDAILQRVEEMRRPFHRRILACLEEGSFIY